MRINEINTQQDACRYAARKSIQVLGPVYNPEDIISACKGIAKGLFGPAFDEATDDQKSTWISMCQLAYYQELLEKDKHFEREFNRWLA